METRKSEWLAAIKPILDREDAKKDAKELAKELGDILEINIDVNPENLKQLTDEFNKQLSKMGKQPIVFSEKTLNGIVNQFAEAIVKGFKTGLGKIGTPDIGLENTNQGIAKKLEELSKRRIELNKQMDNLEHRMSHYENLFDLLDEYDDVKPLKLSKDKDIDEQALRIQGAFVEAEDAVNAATRGTKEYNTALIKAMEAAKDLYRMSKTLDENKDLVKDKTILVDFEVMNLKETTADIFDLAEVDLNKFLAKFDKYRMAQVAKIKAELTSIQTTMDSLNQQDVTIVEDEEAKVQLKTLQEIESAYDRISKKKATKNGHKPMDKVIGALEYVPGDASLATLRNRYNTSLTSGSDWEEQYQWLVKFVKEYEASLVRINAEENKIDKKNHLATLNKYTELYNSLKPLAADAEASLLEVAKRAGYQSDKVAGSAGSVDVSDAQVAQKAREEAEKKAEAEKRAEESLRQQRIEEEKIAKAKAKQRLEDEKIAEAKRKAAAAAELERKARMSAGNVAEGNNATRKEVALSDIVQDVGGKEKFAYLNTETGKISSYIEGEYEGVTKAAMKELLSAINETMNATIHSHPEDIAAPSEEDIQSFVDDIDGFKRNLILAGKQLAEIDFSELTREQAQMIADVYKANVSNTEAERYERLMTSPMKELGISSVDSDRVFAAVSEQLKVRFPALLSDIDAYIEKLRAIFTATPIIDLSQGELEDLISDEVESDFKNQDRNQQSDIYEISKEIIDSATGVPAMYQQELQNIFRQTIEYLDFDASKIFKLYDVDDFQAQLDAAYRRTTEGVAPARDEADIHRKNADTINAEAEAQEELNKVKSVAPEAKKSEVPSSFSDTSSAALEAAQKQIAELQEQKNRELEAKDAEISQIRETSAAKLEAVNNEKITLQNDLDLARQQAQSAQDEAAASQTREAEISKKLAEQESLNQQLRESLANVKTGASEGQASVGSEELKNVLDSIVYNVKIAHDDNDKQANKIAIDEHTLEETLKRVFAKELNPQIEQSDPEPKNEPWALEKTLQEVKETLGQIQANTAKPESVEVAPSKTEVGNVLATENTLAAIKTAVEAINKKVVKGTQAGAAGGEREPKQDAGKLTTYVANDDSDSTSSKGNDKSMKLLADISLQRKNLEKFVVQLQTAGKLTDEYQVWIDNLTTFLDGITSTDDMTIWKKAFARTKTSVGIDDVVGRAEDKETGAAYKELIELQKTRNELELKHAKAQEGSAAKQFYAEQLAQMDQVIARQRVIIDNDEYELKIAKMQETQARKLGEAEAKAADKDAKKQAADAKKTAQKDAMIGKTGNAVGRAETAWMNAGDIMSEASPEVNALIDKYYKKIIALRQEKEKLSQSESIAPAEKDAVIQHTQDLNRMTTEVQELVSEYQKLSGTNVNEANTRTTSLTGESSIQHYQQQMKAYVNEITHGQGQIKSFDAATKTLTYTVKTGSHEFTEYTVALRRVDNSLVSVQGATKKTETFFEATKRKIGEISSYITGMGAINLAKNQLKQGIQYIKEIDLALTELKKVTNETEQTYDKFLDTAAKTANKVGSTIKEIVSSTADWARLNI